MDDQKKNQLVLKLASIFHNNWRESRKLPSGEYEPRIKETSDIDWVVRNGLNSCDIANTEYINLPKDWQEENKAAAEVVANMLFNAIEKGEDVFAHEFLEKSSSMVHTAWLNRNYDWASPEQKVDFDQLSFEEQEKDIDQIRLGLEIYKKMI